MLLPNHIHNVYINFGPFSCISVWLVTFTGKILSFNN